MAAAAFSSMDAASPQALKLVADSVADLSLRLTKELTPAKVKQLALDVLNRAPELRAEFVLRTSFLNALHGVSVEKIPQAFSNLVCKLIHEHRRELVAKIEREVGRDVASRIDRQAMAIITSAQLEEIIIKMCRVGILLPAVAVASLVLCGAGSELVAMAGASMVVGGVVAFGVAAFQLCWTMEEEMESYVDRAVVLPLSCDEFRCKLVNAYQAIWRGQPIADPGPAAGAPLPAPTGVVRGWVWIDPKFALVDQARENAENVLYAKKLRDFVANTHTFGTVAEGVDLIMSQPLTPFSVITSGRCGMELVCRLCDIPVPQPSCMSACLPACLPACLRTGLPAGARTARLPPNVDGVTIFCSPERHAHHLKWVRRFPPSVVQHVHSDCIASVVNQLTLFEKRDSGSVVFITQEEVNARMKYCVILAQNPQVVMHTANVTPTEMADCIVACAGLLEKSAEQGRDELVTRRDKLVEIFDSRRFDNKLAWAKAMLRGFTMEPFFYRELNQELRKGRRNPNLRVASVIAAELCRAMQIWREHLCAKRGLPIPSFTAVRYIYDLEPAVFQQFRDLKDGALVQFVTFMSASRKQQGAQEFCRNGFNVRFEIVIPVSLLHTSALVPVDLAEISVFESEQETLFPPLSLFKVVGSPVAQDVTQAKREVTVRLDLLDYCASPERHLLFAFL